MRFATYNVRYFGHATRGLVSTRGAMHRIAKAFARSTPPIDVICLQEVETRSFRATAAQPRSLRHRTQFDRFSEELHAACVAAGRPEKYEGLYYPAHEYRVGSLRVYTTGLCIFVREPFVVVSHNAEQPADITHRRLESVSRWKQTRVCAHARVRSPDGQETDIFNTHLSLPAAFTAEFWTEPRRLGWGKNQLAEAQAVAEYAMAARGESPVILAGDFNSLPTSPTYSFMVQEAGLVDAYAQFAGLTPEQLVRIPTAGFLTMRMRLDHVFCSPEVRFAEVHESRGVDDLHSAFRGLSDHMPIVGTLVR